MALSLISVNIEGSRHLARVLPFLHERTADVVCIQELLLSDLPAIKEAAGMVEHHFVPMTLKEGVEWGIALFSRHSLITPHERYYHGSREAITEYRKEDMQDTESYALLAADVAAHDEVYKVATTHFIWTPNGQADDFQRRGLAKLLPFLDEEGEFVLCGDFNAPRGGEIYEVLAQHYRDNVPPHYTTSIDVELHRNGKTSREQLLTRMVDYVFTTDGYAASEVTLVPGVSDHMALTATITKS